MCNRYSSGQESSSGDLSQESGWIMDLPVMEVQKIFLDPALQHRSCLSCSRQSLYLVQHR